MPLPILFLLSLTQGVTEFLPISSSGHLVLIWEGAKIAEVPMTFTDTWTQRVIDVAAHVGTLLAVSLFFWKDVIALVCGLCKLAMGQSSDQQAKRFLLLVIASLPLLVGGFFWAQLSDGEIERQLWVVGSASILFGLMIWWADRCSISSLVENDLTPKRAIIFGLFQVLALIPGASRSGVTMAAGRFLGFNREAATKIALLMSMPAIFAAGSLEALKLVTTEPTAVPEGLWQAAALVMLLCGLSAYLVLHLFTRFLPKTGFVPYVIYRIILGIVVLAVAFSLV